MAVALLEEWPFEETQYTFYPFGYCRTEPPKCFLGLRHPLKEIMLDVASTIAQALGFLKSRRWELVDSWDDTLTLALENELVKDSTDQVIEVFRSSSSFELVRLLLGILVGSSWIAFCLMFWTTKEYGKFMKTSVFCLVCLWLGYGVPQGCELGVVKRSDVSGDFGGVCLLLLAVEVVVFGVLKLMEGGEERGEDEEGEEETENQEERVPKVTEVTEEPKEAEVPEEAELQEVKKVLVSIPVESSWENDSRACMKAKVIEEMVEKANRRGRGK